MWDRGARHKPPASGTRATLALWQDGGVSEQSGYPGAPPGWYPDPAGGSGQRWWDGYAWTDTVVVPQPPPPQAWTVPPRQGPPLGAPPWSVASERLHAHNTSGLVAGELAIAPAARVALGVPALAGILVLLVVRMQSSQMLLLGQDFKIAYDDAQRGLPTPTFTNGSFSPWFFALLLVAIAGLVVALVWQRRAATSARALGFPSDYSPAWGVGSWFVPVVNYWFPYLALRDCLPPGHPHRPLVLQWWLAFAVGGSLGFAAFVAGFFSAGVAVGLSIPAAVLYVAAMALAPRVVIAITVAHRDTLNRVSGGGGAGALGAG
jgi:hypothetical protein